MARISDNGFTNSPDPSRRSDSIAGQGNDLSAPSMQPDVPGLSGLRNIQSSKGGDRSERRANEGNPWAVWAAAARDPNDDRAGIVERMRIWEERGNPQVPLDLNDIHLSPETRLPKTMLARVMAVDMSRNDLMLRHLPKDPPLTLQTVLISSSLVTTPQQLPQSYKPLLVAATEIFTLQIKGAQQLEATQKAAELKEWGTGSEVHQQIYERIETWLAKGDPKARLDLNGIRNFVDMVQIELPLHLMPPVAEIDFSQDPDPCLSILPRALPSSLNAIHVSPRFTDEAWPPLSSIYVADPTGLQPLNAQDKWIEGEGAADSNRRARVIARIKEWENQGNVNAPLNLNGISLNLDTRLPKHLMPSVRCIDISQNNFSWGNLSQFLPDTPPASLEVVYVSPELESYRVPEPYRHLAIAKPLESWDNWVAGAFDADARRVVVDRINEWLKLGDSDAPLDLNGIELDHDTKLPASLLPLIKAIDVSQRDDVAGFLPDEPPRSLRHIHISPKVAASMFYPQRYRYMVKATPASPSED
ncbi:hypothetical protein LJR230_004455 [Trinickia sp. LjRoot230]|uniref:hypothetical protein n=1 Tax=Trinickia sp. LjRoot230 TaxID=3342288 RepID=UPI003ECC20B0